MGIVANDWIPYFKEESEKEYYKKLTKTMASEYASRQIFPPKDQIFSAFLLTPYKDVKVVILGQDPYHNDHQAHGLCFSVQKGVEIPPSLVNIYQELHDDLGCYIPNNGYLVKWAEQGVLMLNTVLTVRAHQANSHRMLGWETFTDRVIELVDAKEEPVVFLLWGTPAQKKAEMLHNSPASKPFVGLPRILRVQAFFQNKRISKGARTGTDRLADRKYIVYINTQYLVIKSANYFLTNQYIVV